MCAIIFVEVRCQMAATSTFICCHCLLFCSFLRWCKTPRAEQRPPETIKVSCYMHFLPSVSVLWKMCMAMHFSCKLRSEPEPKTWWLLLPFCFFSFGKFKKWQTQPFSWTWPRTQAIVLSYKWDSSQTRSHSSYYVVSNHCTNRTCYLIGCFQKKQHHCLALVETSAMYSSTSASSKGSSSQVGLESLHVFQTWSRERSHKY